MPNIIPGLGVAVGFAAGFVAGTVLSPVGVLMLPLLAYSQQRSFAGGQTDVLQRPKVVIYPIDETKTHLSEVFTRAPYFLISSGNDKRLVENPYGSTAGNAAYYVVQYVMKFRPDEVVVRNIGRNAADLLESHGVIIRRI